MAVLTAVKFPCKKKYKVANVSDETVSMSDNQESTYCKVKHLSPVDSGRHPSSSCSVKYCILVSALLVSLSLNIVVSIYVWKKGQFPSDTIVSAPYSAGLVSAVHEDSVCTACSTIGVQPDSFGSGQFRDLSVYHIDALYLCCMHNAKGLWQLVSLFADRYHLAVTPDRAGRDFHKVIQRATGAHLYIDSYALKSHPPSLLWTKEYGFGSAYNSSDVLIDNSQFHITRPGLYHIYSFITYKTEQHRHRPDNVVHTISRRNKHLPELGSHVILIDKKTLPEGSEKFMSSYLSATVRMRRDDQLYVRVSNLSYVYRFAPSNFFGLYYVGE